MTDTTERPTRRRRELPKAYRPADFEAAIYERWLAADVFAPDGAGSRADPSLPPFMIIQPPPNITGSLHLGHAQRTAVEDLMIRHARMLRPPDAVPARPRPRLDRGPVRPRPDHRRGGRDARQSLGRERYLERMWRFINETREVMLGQQRRVGGVARLAPPPVHDGRGLGQGRPRGVQPALPRRPRLPHRGAHQLVPGLPDERVATSRSIPTPETGTLWTIRYHLIDEATGEPEPGRDDHRRHDPAGDDPRRHRGRGPPGRPALPRRSSGGRSGSRSSSATCRSSPTRPSSATFGTGAVKITPAHDHDDYATGRRHDLPMITVLDDAAAINETGTPLRRPRPLRGADGGSSPTSRRAATSSRREPHEMLIGRCQRSQRRHRAAPQDPVVHPDRAARRARRSTATRSGRTRILPERFEKVWEHWMTNIHDWNVSRQLWWGHRIPAWYCPDGHVTVSAAERRPDGLRGLRPAGRRADPGPRHLRHLVQLRPVAVLDARLAGRHARPAPLLPDARSWRPGYDIIFFWVARMMMLGHPPDRRRAVPHGLPVRADPGPVRASGCRRRRATSSTRSR